MNGMNVTTGATLSGMEHVRQSVVDILTTPLVSRIQRPDYGSVIPDLIDQPLNQQTILRLYAASAVALMRWEPRLTLQSINLEISYDGIATLDVTGTVAETAFNEQIQLR